MLEVSLRPPVGSHVALAPPGGRGWMLGQGGGQAGRLMPTLAGDGPHNAASWLVPRPGHYLKQVQGTLSSQETGWGWNWGSSEMHYTGTQMGWGPVWRCLDRLCAGRLRLSNPQALETPSWWVC